VCQALAIAHDFIGTQFSDEFVLVRRARHGNGLEACGLGVLHGQMSEPSDTHNGHALMRLRIGPPQAAPDRVAGAKDRRRLLVRQTVRQQHGRISVGQHVFGVTSGHPHTGPDLLLAEHGPAAQAPFAPPA
jgi:hypothetical protein